MVPEAIDIPSPKNNERKLLKEFVEKIEDTTEFRETLRSNLDIKEDILDMRQNQLWTKEILHELVFGTFSLTLILMHRAHTVQNQKNGPQTLPPKTALPFDSPRESGSIEDV